MAQSLAKILVHVVFSTKDRVPFLRDAGLRGELYRYQGGVLRELGCHVMSGGGADDHVHFLFALSRTTTVADTIKELKRVSTIWIKDQRPTLDDFAWQRGYGAFRSDSRSEMR
jgi:putative transposase